MEAADAVLRLHLAQLTAQAVEQCGARRGFHRLLALLPPRLPAALVVELVGVGGVDHRDPPERPARVPDERRSSGPPGDHGHEPGRRVLAGVSAPARHPGAVKRDTWSARLRNRGLVLLSLLGVAAALAFVWDPGSAMLRLTVRVGLRAAALGLAFVIGGLLVLSRHRGARRLPPRLVAWAFVLYGTNQLFYFALIAVPAMRPRTSQLGLLTSIADLILPAMMGGGMIAWLLDEERERLVQATARLEHVTLHDPLTSLPNRSLFGDRLGQALAMAARRGEVVGVVALGIDDFRRFSDHLGLVYGDELLRLLSQRARAVLREGDTLALLREHELGLRAHRGGGRA